MSTDKQIKNATEQLKLTRKFLKNNQTNPYKLRNSQEKIEDLVWNNSAEKMDNADLEYKKGEWDKAEKETLEEGTIREIKEEFGIDVKVVKKLYEMESEKFNQKEYFFLCEYVSGKFGTGEGPEFSNNPKYVDSGKYLPEIIKLEEIKNIPLLPPEIKEKLVEDLEKGIFEFK